MVRNLSNIKVRVPICCDAEGGRDETPQSLFKVSTISFTATYKSGHVVGGLRHHVRDSPFIYHFKGWARDANFFEPPRRVLLEIGKGDYLLWRFKLEDWECLKFTVAKSELLFG